MSGYYNTILISPANSDAPAMMEYCHGYGYAIVDVMTFDWLDRGIGPPDCLEQSVNYVIYIRNNFNQ